MVEKVLFLIFGVRARYERAEGGENRMLYKRYGETVWKRKVDGNKSTKKFHQTRGAKKHCEG